MSRLARASRWAGPTSPARRSRRRTTYRSSSPSFAALDLVPFQINSHYVGPDPTSTYRGETRETRIAEFHEENATPVVGLREGSWIAVEGERMALRGEEPFQLEPPVPRPPSVKER